MPNFLALLVSIFANVCQPAATHTHTSNQPTAHTTHRAHRHTNRTTAPARDVIFHGDPQFRNTREWCVQHPDRCVRMGNTYIIQGQ